MKPIEWIAKFLAQLGGSRTRNNKVFATAQNCYSTGLSLDQDVEYKAANKKELKERCGPTKRRLNL